MSDGLTEFLIFAGIGFFAQLIDGALGMGYGLIAASVLLAGGVSPAQVSASVHAAKLFTTAASGGSHIWHGNIDRRLLLLLSLGGVSGGIIGALLLVQLPSGVMRAYVAAYLLLMGGVIIWRAIRVTGQAKPHGGFVLPLGGVGGFLDAIGGGGWGPVVTSSLIGAGANARQTVGSVNAAEFVVTLGVVTTFMLSFISGLWQETKPIWQNISAIVGLIIGGLPAAFFAGWLVKHAPRRPLMIAVGVMICCLAGFELSQHF